MPLVYGRQLPDYSLIVLDSEIDVLDDKIFLALASSNSSLFRGFRFVESSVPLIRKRFKKIISSDGELSNEQIILFRNITLAQRLICVLSYEALFLNLEDLAVFFGLDDFITGLYFDSREEVRALADSLDANYKKLKTKSFDDARHNLEDIFSEFLSLIHPLCSCNAAFGIQESELEALKAKLDKAEKKITSLKEELAENRVNSSAVRKLEKQIAKLEQINAEKDQKIDELKNRIRQQKDVIEHRTGELDTLRVEHKDVLDSLDTAIEERVREELERLENRWLKTAVETENAVREISDSSDSLLDQSEKILLAQSERDRQFGNIRHLTEMRNKLIKARSELIQARRESINPLDELDGLLDRISKEITKIDTTLGQGGQLSDFTLKCIDRISEASDIDELSELYTMLGSVRRAGVLAYGELSEIEKAYAGRVNALIDTFPENAEFVSAHPFLEFIHSLSDSGSEVVLLLDGHNILHRMSYVFGKYYEDGVPGKASRDALIDIMGIFHENHPNTRVNIYFDGPEASHQNISDRLKVIYSGGGYDEHRADRVIMDYLEFMEKDGTTERVAVVSDDAEVADFASKKGALVLSVNDLSIVISDCRSCR